MSYIGKVISINSATTYFIDVKLNKEDLKLYSDACKGSYTSIKENSLKKEKSDYYSCRVRNLTVSDEEYRAVSNFIRNLIQKTGNFIHLNIHGIDVHKRLLVDIFDENGRNLINILKDKKLIKEDEIENCIDVNLNDLPMYMNE